MGFFTDELSCRIGNHWQTQIFLAQYVPPDLLQVITMSAALTSLFNDFIATASGEHKAWIERAVSMAQAMVDEGEADIALENFCENLIEWQCPISRSLFAQLQQQASALGVDPEIVNALQKQTA